MNALALLPLLASLALASDAPVVRAQWLMGTVCEISAYGPQAGRAESAAFAEIARWDRVLSLYKKESELSRLNASAFKSPFACSDSLWSALEEALRACRETAGAYDPTILPAIKGGPGALSAVGCSKLRLDPARRTAEFTVPGMGLDFGGIGKGIALAEAAAALRANGITAALLNFGGQILAFGAPPGRSDWTVKVPGQDRELLIRDASVSTSGNEERPGHILSPFDGKPILQRGPVTVAAPAAAQADAWSTALFVLGREPSGFPHCALRPGIEPGPACRKHLISPAKGASK